MADFLGDFEKLILFALFRLGRDAYGVTIRREIRDRTGREVSIGSVYTSLQRMEKRGLVTARMGTPTPERGGRRKKHYEITPDGVTALKESYEALRRMAGGLTLGLTTYPETSDV
jgi:PadR family transcriptional regulator PadR